MESTCLQNGTWTRVELNCVRDPNVPDAVGLHPGEDGGGAGGLLVGPDGRVIAMRDGWTMIGISVVVAVILGTAVAFFILFVRKW